MDLEGVAGFRFIHRHALGVEQHPANTELLPRACVACVVAVLEVSDHRTAFAGGVDTNLMCAPRHRFGTNECHARPNPFDRKPRPARLPTLVVNPGPTLATAAHPRRQWPVDHVDVRPPPRDHRDIFFVHPALIPEQRMHPAQEAPPFGNQQTAGRFPVKPVDEFEFRLGTKRPQALDDPRPDPTAAVHRQTRGFVQYDHQIILMEDVGFEALHCNRSGIPCSDPHRRNTDQITLGQPAGWLHSRAVDPDFAATKDSIDSRARHTFEVSQQVIVDSLPRIAFVDGLGSRPGRLWRLPGCQVMTPQRGGGAPLLLILRPADQA